MLSAPISGGRLIFGVCRVKFAYVLSRRGGTGRNKKALATIICLRIHDQRRLRKKHPRGFFFGEVGRVAFVSS